MTKTIVKTYNIAHEHRRIITSVLFFACLAIVFLYGLNVYFVISHTVALQKIGEQISSLENSVDKLDSQYLAISSNITPDSLSKHGMMEGKVSEYISKSVSIGSVAIRGNEL